MQLSKFTDYALRVLIYLGTRPEEEGLATIEEIAERYGISREHLRKVVHHLGQAGYLESRRGRAGGLRLAHAAEDIRIGAVVRSCEESLALVECFQPGASKCQIAGVCGLAGMLHEALEAFLAVLDGYTLHDIVAGQRDLLARLGFPGEPRPYRPGA
jgi:Rrf2 family nitric oxide-sensitive transcriptional repressor